MVSLTPSVDRQYRAFTLVEVLVVVSILSILAAILFPVFSKAREKARQTVCTSNLRQIGQAAAMYQADYEGVYPYAVNYWDKLHPDADYQPPIPASTPVITDVLQPYCHSHEMFHCPSDFGAYPPGNPPVLPSVFAVNQSSYRFDLFVYDKVNHYFNGAESHMDRPSEVIFANDEIGEWHSWRGSDFFHDRSNFLFLDGHVKSSLVADQAGIYNNP